MQHKHISIKEYFIIFNLNVYLEFVSEDWYSRISAGWQSRTLHINSSVVKRIALALPCFKMDKLDNVIPTRSDRVFKDIFRFAIITSRFTIIGILNG